MNLNSLKDIPTSFSLAKKAIVMCIAVSTVVCLGSLSWAFYVTTNFAETAYILTDNGQMALAKGISTADVEAFREPEIKNHINMFHHLFWDFDQYSLEHNMDRALHLIGNSGKELYLTLKAKGHFSKIKTQNLVQTLTIDSLKLNTTMSPAKAAVYGKLKIKRTDQYKEKTDQFTAFFDLHTVLRTDENPHGLLIENYDVQTTPIIE